MSHGFNVKHRFHHNVHLVRPFTCTQTNCYLREFIFFRLATKRRWPGFDTNIFRFWFQSEFVLYFWNFTVYIKNGFCIYNKDAQYPAHRWTRGYLFNLFIHTENGDSPLKYIFFFHNINCFPGVVFIKL